MSVKTLPTMEQCGSEHCKNPCCSQDCCPRLRSLQALWFGRNWADPPLSALGPKLVSNLVSKPGDFPGFFRLSRFFDLLPSITYIFSSSMAWKRSSVRSRPGPPNSQLLTAFSFFHPGSIRRHNTGPAHDLFQGGSSRSSAPMPLATALTVFFTDHLNLLVKGIIIKSIPNKRPITADEENHDRSIRHRAAHTNL